MVKSLLGVVAVLLILGSPCLAAESKAKVKTDVIAAKMVEYDKLGKKDLEDVLEGLQKEVLDAERKLGEAELGVDTGTGGPIDRLPTIRSLTPFYACWN